MMGYGVPGAVARVSAAASWVEAMKAKAWVTAYYDTSRPDMVPVPIDQIVVRVGGEERVLYSAGPNDLQVVGPTVSRDGSRLAFQKVERADSRVHERLYVMDVDGAKGKALVDLTPPGIPTKGVKRAPAPVAWSHDNRVLLLWGTLRGTPRKEPIRLDGFPAQTLMLVDVESGKITPLFEIGRRTLGHGPWGSVLTSQAWAPDNRRLVYMNDDGHVIILDTATRKEQDLGMGEVPTWSPDGRYIALQMTPARGEHASDMGDYFLVRVDNPEERTLLLPNRRTSPSTAYYYGPALWSPDARFLVIWQSERGIEYPYVLDRTTGEIAKMPRGFWGRSWGGKP